MTPIQRIILIILDSVGIGALPDAASYGDEGSNTLGNIARALDGLHLPNMGRMGLGNLTDIIGVPPEPAPPGAFGRMAEASAGKDTTIGHWEITGIISARPLPTYPDGFPPEVIAEFERRTGRRALGNRPASGTVIIQELGEEHLETGDPIVYTSADSVFQVAAHEDVIPVSELYRICCIAREILAGPHAVGRVIARPFTGQPGAFVRTDRRRDFSAPPPARTVLDDILEADMTVSAIGKIEDIFSGRGIGTAIHTHDNMDGVDQTLHSMGAATPGLIFANLVDFDMRYGHRNNAPAYGEALEAFDWRLPEILSRLRKGDVLVISADHGCDPTTPSTDHSREYVPLLIYGDAIRPGVNVGTRETFADLGATVADWLRIRAPLHGTSFASDVTKAS